jgi:hypothetical protein
VGGCRYRLGVPYRSSSQRDPRRYVAYSFFLPVFRPIIDSDLSLYYFTCADKENFVLLMKELRESIGPEKVISLAVSASTIISPEKNNQSLIQAGIDVKLAEYVDMFNVMGYVSPKAAQCIV